MKTLLLHGKYDKMSPLAKEDEFAFRRLLKGRRIALSEQLYIAPVELNSTLICKGFAIEHHQLVYSEGKLYIVFRPILHQYWYRINYHKMANKFYAYYGIVKLCHQPDYVVLLKSHYSGRLLTDEELDGKIQELSLPKTCLAVL